MRLLKKYKNGDMYVTGGIASIEPANLDPIEVYDLSKLELSEINELARDKKMKKFENKIKKIKNG